MQEQAAAPCPNCQHNAVRKVSFTWWGGLLGPKMFNVVECLGCRKQYNGQTGKELGGVIAVYMVVVTIIAIAATVGIMANL